MRNSWFFLMLLLVGCNSTDGEESVVFETGQVSTQHAPEITGLTMSPGEAMHMDSGGFLTVFAEISFRDAGADIESLRVRMPDGSILSIDKNLNTETGTFSERLTLSTEEAGVYEVEFWLVDAVGASANLYTAEFTVRYDIQSSNWTNRLDGLPYYLNDVIWDGDVFIAVGSGGAVLTSVDGIEWIERDSTTDANLNAVSYYGSDIFAVGHEIVLLSTDHGETWVTKAVPDGINLRAIANTASKVVVAGELEQASGERRIIISEDRGDTWREVDSHPPGVVRDLIYRDGLFVAAAQLFWGGAGLSVSSDGESWNEVVAERWTGYAFETIIHDGLQFIVTGYDGITYASLDGFNWTVVPTPVREVLYTSSASNGSKIVLAGSYLCVTSLHGSADDCLGDPPIDIPGAISSIDGGLTWDLFNIDGDFASLGMAWGNGRFVSVGGFGGGAIYTAD